MYTKIQRTQSFEYYAVLRTRMELKNSVSFVSLCTIPFSLCLCVKNKQAESSLYVCLRSVESWQTSGQAYGGQQTAR